MCHLPDIRLTGLDMLYSVYISLIAVRLTHEKYPTDFRLWAWLQGFPWPTREGCPSRTSPSIEVCRLMATRMVTRLGSYIMLP